MADRVTTKTKPADKLVTLELSVNDHADEVIIARGATLVAGSRLQVKASDWKTAQQWLAARPVARHITIIEE